MPRTSDELSSGALLVAVGLVCNQALEDREDKLAWRVAKNLEQRLDDRDACEGRESANARR